MLNHLCLTSNKEKYMFFYENLQLYLTLELKLRNTAYIRI